MTFFNFYEKEEYYVSMYDDKNKLNVKP